MIIESRGPKSLGQLYANYETYRSGRLIYGYPLTTVWAVELAQLTETIFLPNAPRLLPTDLSMFCGYFSLLLLMRLQMAALGNLATTRLIASQEGVNFPQEKSFRNFTTVLKEVRLNDRTIILARQISPPKANKKHRSLEYPPYQILREAGQEQSLLFNKFDQRAAKLFTDEQATARKTAGALELARYKWQAQLSQAPTYPPTYWQLYAKDMVDLIGDRRAKLPSTFSPS